MATTTQSYVPGVCNINRSEIAYRRKAGYVGTGVFMVVLAALLFTPASPWLRLILFLPAFVAAIGFLQAKNKFCVAYGAAGKQNATDGSAAAQAVTEQSALHKDKLRARRMNMQAAAIAAMATALAILIP